MRRITNHRTGTSSTEIPAWVWRLAWGPIKSNDSINIFHLEKGIKQSRGEEFTKGKFTTETEGGEAATKGSSSCSSSCSSSNEPEKFRNRTGLSTTKLVVRFDPDQYRVHESASGLAAPFEDEDDDEHEDE